MADALLEPVVRIRPVGPEDDARCRRLLEQAGLRAEPSLSWIVVRDADPDAVNELLVAGGAHSRVVARERIGQLVGWVIDRGGQVAGRERNVKSLVERVVSDAGLKDRYAPKSDAELVAAAAALHERLMAEGAPFLAWGDFVGAFCDRR